ncbi:DUF7286 family protein [Haloarcula amylovorans]|uniref:DUF7286 family protein n=1 Tax=Haloarcula amylovorans TaxID=2562280 RepID=UPI001FD86F92|nr:hypothetical protein [Halomicroarcula amylolytica]
MREDTRGRVPFALVGVLLLVSSLTLAPTLTPDTVPSDTAVERTLDRASAETQTAMRDGVVTAGRRAAANSVLEPADTPAGRALNDSQPFRDALRLRVYLQVRDRLQRVEARSEGVEATASLPAVETAEEYRSAIDRVTVERAGENGTALRATVENVTLTARRGDRVLTRRDVSPTVTVTTPVLMLHDQMETYETRLHAQIEHPGLSQRLTARLYPMVWARGYAQFGGVPIENVLANRHVSLATNGALLGVQRSTFGRSDPNGRQALTEATAMTSIEDLVTGSNDTAFASELLKQTSYRPVSEDISTGENASEYPQANETMQIGVNETADAAFRTVAAPDTLDATTTDVYTVEVRLVSDSRHIRGGPPDRPEPPGENWTLVAEETSESTETVGDATANPRVPDGWHELRSFGRIVAVEHTRVAVWESVGGNESHRRQTIASRTERQRVSVALVGRHEGKSAALNRPITTAHDPDGSPVGGENLADVAERAERGLIDRAGGRDAVAARAADGGLRTRTVPVTAERPAELRAWVYRDLRRLRERVRATNVTVERGAAGTFETNPAHRLRQLLAERRAALADVPETYDSAAQKARVAARLTYLDAVDERLAARAKGRATAGAKVDSRLQERTGGSLRDVRRSLTARETQVPRARPVPTGPAGPVRTRVDARPQYLTLASLDESRHPAIDGSEHPLVARNVNVFTVPYGDAADAVTMGATASTDRTRLSTAATALAAANATAVNVTTEAAENESLNEHRATLNDRVRDANDHVAVELRATVRKETGADRRASRRIVTAGLSRWNATHARGLALANGRAAESIAAVAAERRTLSAVERDWLRVRLSGTINDALKRPLARPREPVVNRTTSATRTVAREALHATVANATEHRAKQLAKKRFGKKVLPAGAPLAPPLTPWYATMNLWWVTVEGEYARFAVTANHGTPTTPAATTTYVRDDATVRLDVDDDGEREVLGRNERLSFRAETGVVVVVGPKPRGVGDKDGQAVETSAGWPNAGR